MHFVWGKVSTEWIKCILIFNYGVLTVDVNYLQVGSIVKLLLQSKFILFVWANYLVVKF